MSESAPRKFRWRPWLRGLHRDVGYLAVGLTIIYALSGLAVNHIGDWDPSYRQFERSTTVNGTLPETDAEAAAEVLEQLGISDEPRAVYRFDEELQIELDDHDIVVDLSTGSVLDRGQRPRFFLRLANWLHLQRGKKAWNFIADAYAIFLLFLALSGIFMLPGRRGFVGRGAIFIAVGVAAPALYVVMSGGPGAHDEDALAGEQDPEEPAMMAPPPPPPAPASPEPAESP